MSKMYQIQPSTDDLVERALLTNTIANDPLVYRNFPTVEQAHDALDDFCERKGLPMSAFNVQTVIA